MSLADLPDHVRVNRDHWTNVNSRHTDAAAAESWAREEICWGLWHIREREVNVLPVLAGKDVIELGCGTAYFSAWVKRCRAARVVGVDVTPAQLDTARRLDAEYELGLELIEANAEEVPLPDSSFDLALSEYGASIWCNPERWIPEAARLLRPGGDLVFMRGSTLSQLCMPDSGRVADRLLRPQRGMYRLEWTDDDSGVEFHPPTGVMLRLLLNAGFEVLDLVELFAPPGAKDHPFYDYMSSEWATSWPAEEIWRARKRA